MSDESLVQAIPDIVAFVRPDGLITHHVGGRNLPLSSVKGSIAGRRLSEVFEPDVAELLVRVVRRALANRESCLAEFALENAAYSARIAPQGPNRALCIISHDAAEHTARHRTDARPGGAPDDRDFLARLQRAVAEAQLRERPLALAVIFLDGLEDIGKLVDFSVSDRIQREVLSRIPADMQAGGWVQPLGEGMLGILIEESNERNRIQEIVGTLCASLSRPVQLHGATFQLRAHAGVAIHGRDAAKAKPLLEHAKAALFEARRADSGTVQFYSDTVRMLPVLRVDIERELRKGIADGQIELAYLGRHELASGRLAGLHAYMRWTHPLRGEIAPGEFLKIAEATNLAVAASHAALQRLALDLPRLHERFGRDMPISFGALRQHITSGKLLRDWKKLSAESGFSAGRIEFRISERTLGALNRPERLLRGLVEHGVSWVMDEIGRAFTSFASLAQMPLTALQIDRALVVAAQHDAAARSACRAILAVAAALELPSIAAGVDVESTRAMMAGLGCQQGLGDLYADAPERAALFLSIPGLDGRGRA